jgi:hypothetical protein
MKDNIKIKNYCDVYIETNDDMILFFLKNIKIKKDDMDDDNLCVDNLYEFCENNCDICIDTSEDFHYVVELDNIINFDKMFTISGERVTLKIKNMKKKKKGSNDDNYMASIIIKNPNLDDGSFISSGVFKQFVINFSELQFLRFYKDVSKYIDVNKIPEYFMESGDVKKVYKIKLDDYKKIYYNKRRLNVHQRAFLRIIRIIEKFIVFINKK